MADEDNMEFDFEEQLDVQPEVVPPAGDQGNMQLAVVAADDAEQAQPKEKNYRQTVCAFWLRGMCMKGDSCGFLHKFDPERMPVCRVWMKTGECKELECPFKHSLDDVKECNMYKLGFCIYGTNCRYKHTKQPGPPPDPDTVEAAKPREFRDWRKIMADDKSFQQQQHHRDRDRDRQRGGGRDTLLALPAPQQQPQQQQQQQQPMLALPGPPGMTQQQVDANIMQQQQQQQLPGVMSDTQASMMGMGLPGAMPGLQGNGMPGMPGTVPNLAGMPGAMSAMGPGFGLGPPGAGFPMPGISSMAGMHAGMAGMNPIMAQAMMLNMMSGGMGAVNPAMAHMGPGMPPPPPAMQRQQQRGGRGGMRRY